MAGRTLRAAVDCAAEAMEPDGCVEKLVRHALELGSALEAGAHTELGLSVLLAVAGSLVSAALAAKEDGEGNIVSRVIHNINAAMDVRGLLAKVTCPNSIYRICR